MVELKVIRNFLDDQAHQNHCCFFNLMHPFIYMPDEARNGQTLHQVGQTAVTLACVQLSKEWLITGPYSPQRRNHKEHHSASTVNNNI